MASKITVALGLLVLAAFSYTAGVAWLTLSLFLLAMVSLAFGGGSYEPAIGPREVKIKADSKLPKSLSQEIAEQEAKMASVDQLKFRPSTPSDGIAGVNPMSVKGPHGQVVGVGPRSGQISIDCGPVRFKDDLRIRPSVVDKNFLPEGKLIAWHFRTQTPIFYQKTKMLEASIDGWDKELWDIPEWDIDK
ncbi:MAG: hypothetical protein JXB14_05525 [Candidatus Altiarchaeota archaeon]|nr:hypothetical protein [Candidatus Altiarchaeota archaeon]